MTGCTSGKSPWPWLAAAIGRGPPPSPPPLPLPPPGRFVLKPPSPPTLPHHLLIKLGRRGMGRESGVRVPRGNDTEYKCAVGAGAGGGGGARPAHVEVFALQSGAELAVAVAHEQARLIPPRRGSTDAGIFFLPLYFYFLSVCVLSFLSVPLNCDSLPVLRRGKNSNNKPDSCWNS